MIVFVLATHLVRLVGYQFLVFRTLLPVIPASLAQEGVVPAELVVLVNPYRLATRHAGVGYAFGVAVQAGAARREHRLGHRLVTVTTFFTHHGMGTVTV